MKINNLDVIRAIRVMESDRYREDPIPADLPKFLNAVIMPLLPLEGYKIPEQRQIALHCLHNLLRTGAADRVVVDSRNTAKTPRMRIRVWDKYVGAGLADQATGSEWSEKDSRYIATSGLLNRRELWEQSLLRNVGANGPLVVLTSGDVDRNVGTDLPEQPENQLLNIKEAAVELAWRRTRGDFDQTVKDAYEIVRTITYMQDIINDVNTMNCEHTWKVDIERPSVGGGTPIKTAAQVCHTLRQLHSGALFRAMRLYTVGSPGQNMKRAQRATMRIDGQRTVEPDFMCQHLWMLYHLEGLLPTANDLYRPERIFPRFHATNPSEEQKLLVRNFAKLATLFSDN